jgi:hypothetical protein
MAGEAMISVDARRNWTLCATTVARVFLAAILLLSASTTIFQLTVQGELAFSFELLLGAAIAAGWLVQYAAALVLLGMPAASFLVPHFHLASLPPNVWATTAVLVASGILMCFGRNSGNCDAARIDEHYRLSNDDACRRARDNGKEEVEITIRLEDGYLRSPRRHRCIVTIHDRGEGVRKTGQEAWYARDDN